MSIATVVNSSVLYIPHSVKTFYKNVQWLRHNICKQRSEQSPRPVNGQNGFGSGFLTMGTYFRVGEVGGISGVWVITNVQNVFTFLKRELQCSQSPQSILLPSRISLCRTSVCFLIYYNLLYFFICVAGRRLTYGDSGGNGVITLHSPSISCVTKQYVSICVHVGEGFANRI